MTDNSEIYGKLNNIEAEQAILGAMLIDNDCIDDITLEGKEFYKPDHAILFNKIKELSVELSSTDKQADIVTLSDKLIKEKIYDKIGGAFYITSLMETVSTATNVIKHANIVKDLYNRRIAFKASERLIQALSSDTPTTLLVDNFNASMDVLGGLNGTLQYSLSSHLKTALTSIENDMDADESTYRILTGFRQLDNNLVLRKENLVIIGARPAVGKSAFSANLAYGISKTNKIGIISLEMSGEEIMERFIAMESEINGFDIARRNLDDDKYNKIIKHTQELSKNENLVIDDDFHSSLDSVVARCKRLKRKFGVECIIIDYLQLVTTKGYNKNDEVGKISRTFKMLAKELRIPIIVLSQLSRTIESRENDCPRLSDLRDSGSLEQDANTVIFLWKETNDPLNDMIDITIAKQRQGRLASFKMIFEKRYQKFKDVSMM